MEYPERPTLVWSTDGPSSEVLPPETAAGQGARGARDWENPDAAEEGSNNDDNAGLSAPIVYASLVLGMITVFKDADGTDAAAVSGGEVLEKGHSGAGRVSVGALPAEDEGAEPHAAAAWGERVSWVGVGVGAGGRECVRRAHDGWLLFDARFRRSGSNDRDCSLPLLEDSLERAVECSRHRVRWCVSVPRGKHGVDDASTRYALRTECPDRDVTAVAVSVRQFNHAQSHPNTVTYNVSAL